MTIQDRVVCLNCGGTGTGIILSPGYGESITLCSFCDGLGYHPKGENKPMKTMTRRYYKTHSAIQRPQILSLYSEAVSQATACIESGKEEEYYIVEVVAVVKRQKPIVNPIVVEEINKG